MGRHTARRASFPAALVSAARRGTHGTGSAAPRRRRTLGTGAAVAAVALTASTAAAAFANGAVPSAATDATEAAPAGAPTPGTAVAPVSLGTSAAPATADPATVDAAGDVLVRAQFLTGEGAAALTPEQVAQIEDARTRLSEAVSEASPSEDATTLLGSPAGSGLASPDDGATATAEATEEPATDDTLTAAETLGASVPALDGRADDRASRSSARTPLDELEAAVPKLGTATPGLATAPDDATPGTDAAAPSAGADAATESPEEDAAAADTATDAPDLTTGTGNANAGAPAADAEAPADPAAPAGTEEIAALTAELTTLLDAAGSGVTVQVVPGPPSAEEVAAQLDQWATSTAGYGNGQIPASALCELSFAPGEQLRCDAAHQIEALNEKYREAFGANLSVTDSYRSYASQVAVKASRGYFAAPPGMSNHGWALALDLGGGIQSYGTAQYEWMRANAPAYGWENPEWARAGGSKNEPWHWEYGDIS
ncbi:D-alanyl-D-alanine carboxypeptidase [Cellulosimicrobium aquatile]|uniref:D-alanyl-D-alanine carboxypeptidase n=1 Tax=Cellulosimicrobium aquatile TaxID=1612203 RepID=A0A1N6NDI3_9MICO|nr:MULTISPECIES: M15 family metallopeptidase [Cellulosimicrobium]MCM3533492.1 M15 family metallopeptidase [Cellulosimicrobium funkei]MDQ8041212.1 M15 family metallopeptidase [Cellulosimicrobium sp. XJ-DQ-B-000]SIP90111.1 D-alanyl-D-alanine carboxypeptidase [Cellulosimicrobium aquatile]